MQQHGCLSGTACWEHRTTNAKNTYWTISFMWSSSKAKLVFAENKSEHLLLLTREKVTIMFSTLGISSVQFSHSVVSSSLQPHELQHTRPPCPSPTPKVHPNSCPSSQWCYPAISSSAMSSPSSPAPNPSQHQSLFQWVNSSHQVAKVLEFQL